MFKKTLRSFNLNWVLAVEGILSEPVPASGGAKDGGVSTQTKTAQDRAQSARVQHEKSPSEPQVFEYHTLKCYEKKCLFLGL